ncbi:MULTISPECIES: DUF3943 domain-containing protein [Cysteiniphilum]|uniref:DUF3943 domain-containing protein n=1 Tax=Cysteiniphilum litorale TaxID=2056700 RepID=A0A8J2Z3Z5_9GAMM|nr:MULTISPECIES: DUF3943 domain-containing protein [Cysteiniphilum]GGF96734.1 hypothetical protein GCM10010995_12480 [Cysteiniphilum litorale]
MQYIQIVFVFLITFFSTHLYANNLNKLPSDLNIATSVFAPNVVAVAAPPTDHKYMTENDIPDWGGLMDRSLSLLGLSVVAVGAIALMPQSISNWEIDDNAISNLPKKWWDNVSSGPVWDNDKWYINYIGHPYAGAIYYMAARDSGFGEFESFLYSAFISTFFWEYGVEAFAEVPSIQDLIVTPVGGWLLGEYAFIPLYRYIEQNNGELIGSQTLGSIVKFVINPMFDLSHLFGFDTKSYLKLETARFNKSNNTISSLDKTHDDRYIKATFSLSF